MTEAKSANRRTPKAAKPRVAAVAAAVAPEPVAAVAEPVTVEAVAIPETPAAPVEPVTAVEPVEAEAPPAEAVAAGDAATEPGEALRELAEQAVIRAKTGFERVREVVDGTGVAIGDACEIARAGFVEINARSLAALQEHTDAAHAHALDLLAVSTLAEAIELNSSYLRRRFEAFSAQAKGLQAVAVRRAGEAMVPTGEAFGRALGVMRGED
jgi:hypothetical protein